MAVLTISRQFGAGGRTLAEKVSEQIGYKVAHEEVIEKLAEKAKVSADVVKAFEDEGRGLIRRASSLLTPQRFIDHVLDPKRNYMDGDTYVDLLHKIIPEVADEGNIIILGRGAQFVLKARLDTYHVLLVASREHRIRFMQEKYELSEGKAREVVDKQSKRREKLMRLFRHGDYDEPTRYDMTLNMSKISMDSSVDLVVDLVNSDAKGKKAA